MSGYDYLDRDGPEAWRWQGQEPGTPLFAPPPPTGLSRVRQGATRLGISTAEYLEHRERGEAWCGQHRAWEPAERFGTQVKRGTRTLRGRCREGERERAAARRAGDR